MKNSINKKTSYIFKKVLKINLNNKNFLNKKIFDMCDSIKFMELLVEIEKNSKKKISNKKIETVKDINNLFNDLKKSFNNRMFRSNR